MAGLLIFMGKLGRFLVRLDESGEHFCVVDDPTCTSNANRCEVCDSYRWW